MIDPNDLRNIVRKPPLWMVLLAMFGLYFSLIIPTLDRLGIGWDEATDLLISRTYMSRSGLLFGSSLDPSQTRLPMFVGALVFRLLGTSSLMIARFTTVVVGGLTLLGVYFLGKEQFNHKTGLLAVGLLAINPFFSIFCQAVFYGIRCVFGMCAGLVAGIARTPEENKPPWICRIERDLTRAFYFFKSDGAGHSVRLAWSARFLVHFS